MTDRHTSGPFRRRLSPIDGRVAIEFTTVCRDTGTAMRKYLG